MSAFGIQTASACTHAPPKWIAQQRAIKRGAIPVLRGRAHRRRKSCRSYPISREHFLYVDSDSFRCFFILVFFYYVRVNILLVGGIQ